MTGWAAPAGGQGVGLATERKLNILIRFLGRGGTQPEPDDSEQSGSGSREGKCARAGPGQAVRVGEPAKSPPGGPGIGPPRLVPRRPFRAALSSARRLRRAGQPIVMGSPGSLTVRPGGGGGCAPEGGDGWAGAAAGRAALRVAEAAGRWTGNLEKPQLLMYGPKSLFVSQGKIDIGAWRSRRSPAPGLTRSAPPYAGARRAHDAPGLTRCAR